MKDWQLDLAPRWNSLCAKGRTLGWHEEGSPYIADLAAQHGLKWYAQRSQDQVEEFMRHDADGLFNRIPSFGRIKCMHLIEILEAAADGVIVPTEPAAHVPSFTLSCTEVLQLWGVPSDYPLHLLPLSTRLMNFCEEQQVETLSALLELWATLGRAGLVAHDNIGQRTANELQALACAIAKADATAARRWLPLNDLENGLCLRRALALSFSMLPDQVVVILTRRLVDKITLEESAQGFGLTRERVRQYEAAYLRDIRAILDWFSTAHAQMLDAWTESAPWQAPVLPQDSETATTLILAGIEACFDDTPQGVAKRLATESTKESWSEQLCSHPDLHLGGVDLQTFLDATVPADQHGEFITGLAGDRSLILDLVEGLVKPAVPCVRDTVCAILAQEEEPIPLTWLAMRVQAVEGCEEGDADFIERNRYRWSMLGFLDLERVLWDE